jgi:hypothetical protein
MLKEIKMQTTKPAPTAKYVRSVGPFGGWGGFKHHLVRIGVIANADCDAPIEWQRAFCAAFGRTLTNERKV